MFVITTLLRTAIIDACASIEAILVAVIALCIIDQPGHAFAAGALAAFLLASTALALRSARRRPQTCRATITHTAVLDPERTDRWAHTLAWSCGAALALGIDPNLFTLAFIALQLLWIARARPPRIRFHTRFTVAMALTTIIYQTTVFVAGPLSATGHLWAWLLSVVVATTGMRPATFLLVMRHVPPANPSLWHAGYQEHIGATPHGEIIALYTKGVPAPTATYRPFANGQWVEHTAHGETETEPRLALDAP